MTTLLGVNFQQVFASALGGQLLPVTLGKQTAGTIDPSDPTAGTSPTTTSYTCKGTTDKWRDEAPRDGTMGDSVRMKTFEVIILLGTMSTAGVIPRPGDTITIVPPGESAAITARIDLDKDAVKIDPAGASAICKCSG